MLSVLHCIIIQATSRRCSRTQTNMLTRSPYRLDITNSESGEEADFVIIRRYLYVQSYSN